ncbi:MAG: ABC transporter ATP-binding protein [Syntrophorhabdales bacterium]|jgi:branched-chain amino acid transport system ATP-binding protein
MAVILRTEDLFKDFSGLEIIRGITMEVYEGERHMIIGPNGAGKSTLFNLITGLYKPSRGRIHFLKRDITRLPLHKIARLGISRSFQIINVFPMMTVFENVRNAVISKAHRRFNWVSILSKDREIERETRRVLDILSLQDVRDDLASELSYGRQRHLELALTVAQDPVLIMLDEPTAGLNSEESRSAVRLIRQVTEGRTLVMVEHDMDVVFGLADRITVLNDGTILACGSPEEIRKNEEVRKAYLERRTGAAAGG